MLIRRFLLNVPTLKKTARRIPFEEHTGNQDPIKKYGDQHIERLTNKYVKHDGDYTDLTYLYFAFASPQDKAYNLHINSDLTLTLSLNAELEAMRHCLFNTLTIQRRGYCFDRHVSVRRRSNFARRRFRAALRMKFE